MEWHEATDYVLKYIVRITTPSGHGTGFYLSKTTNPDDCLIATAAHVIQHAHEWDEPIRIEHQASGKSVVLKFRERFIFIEGSCDVAGIIFRKSDIPFPETAMQFAPAGKSLKTGAEVGWLGFPALAPDGAMCFFSGRISSYISSISAYLVDGVAINGVSGGPAFTNLGDQVSLIGVVSAYIPNRATGQALPGVSLVRDIAALRAYAKVFSSSIDSEEGNAEISSAPAPGACS